ncbi:MAG: cation diffusion facilitator family transporter [Arcanobacterium sp.]|nr:cation diffusion facilitator family transporter [Arcanobacterium sp.]
MHNQRHNNHTHTHASDSTPVSRLLIVLVLSGSVMVAELVGAVISGSLSLLTDSGHMLSDSAGLAIALIAAHTMRRPRTDRFTWGFARSEVISAAAQAGILLVVCVAVTVEAAHRFIAPPEIHAQSMAIFAAIGLVANLIGLLLLRSHADSSLNTRAAFLEVLNDTFGSLAVLAAAAVTALTHWSYADPIATLIVAALMAPRAINMLIRCIHILLEGTPADIELAQVREHMLSQPLVIDVHDLHVSNISSNRVALTAHVTVDPEAFVDGSAISLLHSLQECASEHFPLHVDHCTIQLDVPAHRDHEHLEH